MKKFELFKYLFFGVCTTIVNITTYVLLASFFGVGFKAATTVAWMISVVFAFFVNRKYVFVSENYKFVSIIKELLLFTVLRLLSYLFDLAGMIILVDYFVIDDVIAKIITNIIVIVANYFASKFIFKSTN
ncbi:GtrA family protein [Paenibacillus terrae]|uniref:GtrA family protein n=1 Tax=Paenibacillus terrae TaxID=159743 RepID=UPI0011EB5BB2|nr:GtrA family protein [Paenibacillus terrae]